MLGVPRNEEKLEHPGDLSCNPLPALHLLLLWASSSASVSSFIPRVMIPCEDEEGNVSVENNCYNWFACLGFLTAHVHLGADVLVPVVPPSVLNFSS